MSEPSGGAAGGASERAATQPRRSHTLLGLALAGLIGLAGGAGAYTFVYAKGASYLTNDPQACANCHIMDSQYRGWLQGSHRSAATCNDCHTPHDFFGKYLTKASNGLHHSIAFTSGDFHEPIAIKPHNLAITEAACRSCHAEIVDAIGADVHGRDAVSCVRCHADVGHRH